MDATLVQEIMQHYNVGKEFFQEQVGDVVEAVDEADAPLMARSKSKQIPSFNVYHLHYDREGNVVDYHIDRFRMDPNSLMKKLQRRYSSGDAGAGRAIWVTKLPPGAQQKKGTIFCEHPSCSGGPFNSEEERDVHMLAYHREWKELKDKERERRYRQEEMGVLKAQVDVLASAVNELVAARTAAPLEASEAIAPGARPVKRG